MDRIRKLRHDLALVRHSREELAEPGPGLVLHGKELTPTPIYIGRRTRLILLAGIVVALVWLAREAPSVPRLLLLGSTVALVLSFPVRVLSTFLPRGLAILIVIGSTIALSILALVLLIPFMVAEISRFVTNLPDTADATQNLMRDVLIEFRRRGWMEQNPDAVIADIRANLIDRGESIVQTLLSNLLATLTRTLTIILTVFGILFVATYLLIDIPRFRQNFIHAFAPAYRDDAALLWFTVGDSLSRYLAGLLISIVIQGTMATIGLSFLGIPYAVVLGLWMSITAVLPYIGAFLGAIPSILIALTISWETAVLVTVLYIVINQLEGNLITPRIQGEAVRVHPLLIFIAIIAGGEMAGLLGAILAVPILAVARVLLEFLWVRLRTRYPEDTVLVALGGTGAGADTASEAEDGDGDDVLIEVDAETEVEPEPTSRADKTEISVHIATNRRVPITRHRTRPPVRRRRKALV
jgi:predicted PurR-regulated permease PerM